MKNTKIILILNFILFSTPVFTKGFSVQPLLFEFDSQRKKYREDFTIKIKTDKKLKIETQLYQAKQDLDGRLSFEAIENSGAILKMNKNSLSFAGPGEKSLSGTINVKGNRPDTKLYALMVEETKQKASKGIGIQVRYAVILKLNARPSRAKYKYKISRPSHTIDIKNQAISMIFKNQSAADIRLSANVKIRDSQNKLISKLKIKTTAAWLRGDEQSLILPNSKVMLQGQLPNNLKAGKYKVSIRGKINDKKPVSSTGYISIHK